MTASRQMLAQVLRRLRLGISAEQIARKLEWGVDFVNKIESSAIPMNADKIINAYSAAVNELREEGVQRPQRLELRTRLASNLLANEPLLNAREYVVIQGFFLKHQHDTPPVLPEEAAEVFYGTSQYPSTYLQSDIGPELMRRAYNTGRDLTSLVDLPAPPVSATEVKAPAEIDFSALFGAEDTLTLRLKIVKDENGKSAIRLERAWG